MLGSGVGKADAAGSWGQTWSRLLELGVSRWRYTLTATNHRPAQLCSLFCASPGQSKRGGWRQRTAREPSCSGAFQVGGTTHGGRKELGDRDESALVPAFRQLLASLIGSTIASLQVGHSFSETVLRGGIADSGGESGKAAWRGRHLYAQHRTLVRRESEDHLCLPRSIWDAETETAAFPALLPK